MTGCECLFGFVWRGLKECKMKKILLFLLLIIFCITPGRSEKTVEKKNLLWQIKTEHNTVYLFGSIHILIKDNYPLNEVIENAFNNSDVFVAEMNIEVKKSPEAMKKILQIGMLSNETTLKEVVNEKTYKMLEEALEDMNGDINKFARFKPWLVADLLRARKMMQLKFKRKGGKTKDKKKEIPGVDFYFYYKAKDEKKEILFLETGEDQMAILNMQDRLDPDAVLQQAIKHLKVIEKGLVNLAELWSTGNTEELSSIISESYNEFPELKEALFFKRNKNWVKKIKSYLKDKKNYFITVGAGHLVGTNSVVELLQKEGYKVEQL